MNRVLIACEESQVVTNAMRAMGLDAFSCDVVPTSGDHPEWHIQGDVLDIIDQDWAMIIAFPPCTHLCSSGARWFSEKKKDGRQQSGIDFFLKFTQLKCERVAIENPIGIMSSIYAKPDQIIQPWMFGHGETKATCLWLKNLPKLKATKVVEGRDQVVFKMPPSQERSKLRSKTYVGVAKAMAQQWGRLVKR